MTIPKSFWSLEPSLDVTSTRKENVPAAVGAPMIVPVFALANSGVRLAGLDLRSAGAGGVAIGVFVALVVGKLVGVFA